MKKKQLQTAEVFIYLNVLDIPCMFSKLRGVLVQTCLPQKKQKLEMEEPGNLAKISIFARYNFCAIHSLSSSQAEVIFCCLFECLIFNFVPEHYRILRNLRNLYFFCLPCVPVQPCSLSFLVVLLGEIWTMRKPWERG